MILWSVGLRGGQSGEAVGDLLHDRGSAWDCLSSRPSTSCSSLRGKDQSAHDIEGEALFQGWVASVQFSVKSRDVLHTQGT